MTAMRVTLVLGILTLPGQPAHGQSDKPAPSVTFAAGHSTFPDESWNSHLVAGGSVRYHFSRSGAVEPEIFLMRRRRDHDLVVVPSLVYDFSPGSRVAAYIIGGAGLLRHWGEYVSGSTWSPSIGFGVRTFINERWFISPEIRVGWEPFSRFTVGAGYRFPRR
jgi:hypothetical protein